MVNGPVSISSIAAFIAADVESETGSFGDDQITVESFVMNGDTFESITSDVNLGSQLKVAFSIGNKDMPIYVKSWKKDAATDDAVDFYTVENGCDNRENWTRTKSCFVLTAEKVLSVELWFDQGSGLSALVQQVHCQLFNE